jgi:hypothetical protein
MCLDQKLDCLLIFGDGQQYSFMGIYIPILFGFQYEMDEHNPLIPCKMT